MSYLGLIGFGEGELFPCETLASTRILVPATIEGTAATLLLSTGTRLDVFLDLEYIAERGMRFERRNETFGTTPTGEFTALGRQREHAIATVRGSTGNRQVNLPTNAGSMGVLFFSDGVLAIDAAAPMLGWTTSAAIRDWPSPPTVRLPLVPGVQDRVPFTRAVTVEGLDGGEATFHLDTGSTGSFVSSDYLRRAANRRRARSLLRSSDSSEDREVVSLGLPGGRTIDQRVWVESKLEDRIGDWGVDRCDGILGMDFLRRWVTVFDLPREEVLLWDYMALREE